MRDFLDIVAYSHRALYNLNDGDNYYRKNYHKFSKFVRFAIINRQRFPDSETIVKWAIFHRIDKFNTSLPINVECRRTIQRSARQLRP